MQEKFSRILTDNEQNLAKFYVARILFRKETDLA